VFFETHCRQHWLAHCMGSMILPRELYSNTGLLAGTLLMISK